MLFVTVIAAITSIAVFTITAIIIVCLATPSAVLRSSQNEASDLVMKMRPTKHPRVEVRFMSTSPLRLCPKSDP